MIDWRQLLSRWRLIENDLHTEYGIDAGSGILRERSASWLRSRIEGLISTDSRLSRALRAEKEGR